MVDREGAGHKKTRRVMPGITPSYGYVRLMHQSYRNAALRRRTGDDHAEASLRYPASESPHSLL
jgi:hypothetical protein